MGIVIPSILIGCGAAPTGTAVESLGNAPNMALPVDAPADRPASIAAPQPWVRACTLLTEADVLAVTAATGAKVAVVGNHESNDTIGDLCVSQCRYDTSTNLKSKPSARGPSRIDQQVVLTIRERSGLAEFVPPGVTELVGGVGEHAYWNDPHNDTLEVLSGNRRFTFESYAPPPAGNHDVKGVRRAAALRLATIVMARVG